MVPHTRVPVVALILLALSSAGLWAADDPIDCRPDDRFDAPGLGLPAPVFVLEQKTADVTGDGAADVVFLVGAKERAEQAYSRETWLVIRDGQTGEHAAVRPGPLTGGYGGELFVGDFTGDGLAEILTGLPTGGSGGTVAYSLISYRDRQPTVLFDQERLTRAPKLSVQFAEGFAASVFCGELGRAFDLDLGAARERYVEAGIYDEGGHLLKETAGAVDPYTIIQPSDPDGDGVHDLVGLQRIWGIGHADTIGIAQAVWHWNGMGWELADLRVVDAASAAQLPDRPLDTPQRFRGHLALGPEARVLRPCGSEENIWVTDHTGELWEIYQSLTSEPYGEVFVDILGRLASPPAEGPGRSYARHLLVVKVLRVAYEGHGCEQDLSRVRFNAGGNEPFWHVKIGEDGIAFLEPLRPAVEFPAVPAARGPERWIYYTTAEQPEQHWLLAVIDEKPCVDSMSGEYSCYSAELVIDGQRFTGCAVRGLSSEE